MPRTVSASAQVPRDPSNKPTDIAAVRMIAQAAIDVELFTIPLYMTALYSIEGYRENNDAPPAPPLPPLPHGPLYKGRLWPGATTSAVSPMPPNQEAFNIIFSIFIEEMLHLQMAANMAASIGVKPSFTSAALQDANHGWICYGPANSVIPYIVDLKDTTDENVPVNIGPLDGPRVQLFLAIEQDEQAALAALGPNAPKYEITTPFPNWTSSQLLPMFGTIGQMYRSYWDYLNLRYTDGTTLWEAVYVADALGAGQQDYFNCGRGTQAEYPQVQLHIGGLLCGSPLQQMGAMIDAITDQGEGSLPTDPGPPSPDVLAQYQADRAALEANYHSYNSDGGPEPSADAAARCLEDLTDHYARFQRIQALLPGVTTWATAGKAGNWTATDLTNSEYDPANLYGLPTPADMAAAMNMMANDQPETYFALLSQAIVADIAAVTTTLNEYWSTNADPTISFPTPSMTQSGDRMSTIWATFGHPPDLSLGVPAIPAGLNHSCQGLSIEAKGANDCAQVELFHGCIGTNNCMAQGGCGFPHHCTKGGGCGASSTQAQDGSSDGGMKCGVRVMKAGGGVKCGAPATKCGDSVKCGGGESCSPPSPEGNGAKCGAKAAASVGGSVAGGCTPGVFTSAPGDNKCAGFGGCSVPISAFQLYPKGGVMQVFDFQPDSDPNPVWIGSLTFNPGDKVPDIAYQAFSQVMTHRSQTAPPQQAPSALRLVFPPST